MKPAVPSEIAELNFNSILYYFNADSAIAVHVITGVITVGDHF